MYTLTTVLAQPFPLLLLALGVGLWRLRRSGESKPWTRRLVAAVFLLLYAISTPAVFAKVGQHGRGRVSFLGVTRVLRSQSWHNSRKGSECYAV